MASRPAVADYVLGCVCVCIINFCYQHLSKSNLWIFAKFITNNPYTLPWKRLTVGAAQIHNNCERTTQIL